MKGGELKAKSFHHRRRLRSPFLWAVAAIAAFLLADLAVAVIEELPRLINGLGWN